MKLTINTFNRKFKYKNVISWNSCISDGKITYNINAIDGEKHLTINEYELIWEKTD